MNDPMRTIDALDTAVHDHHREVYKDDDPTTVIGWVVGYTAVDGDGRDIVNYAAGPGTPLALGVGILDLVKATLTDMAVSSNPHEEDES